MMDSAPSSVAVATPITLAKLQHIHDILENIRQLCRLDRSTSITDQDARLYVELATNAIKHHLPEGVEEEEVMILSHSSRELSIRQVPVTCDSEKCEAIIITLFASTDTAQSKSFAQFANHADKLFCLTCSGAQYQTALAAWQSALDQYSKTKVMTTEERAACDARSLQQVPGMKRERAFKKRAPQMWMQLHEQKRPENPANIEKKIDNAYRGTMGWKKEVCEPLEASVAPSTTYQPPQVQLPPAKYELHPPKSLPVASVVQYIMEQMQWSREQTFRFLFRYLRSENIQTILQSTPDTRLLICSLCSDQVDCPTLADLLADTTLLQMAAPDTGHCGCGVPDPARVDGIEEFEEGLNYLTNNFETVESAKSTDVIESTPSIFPAVPAVIRTIDTEIEGSTTQDALELDDAEQPLKPSGLTMATQGMQTIGASAGEGAELKVMSREEARVAVEDGLHASEARGMKQATEEEMKTSSVSNQTSSAEVRNLLSAKCSGSGPSDLEIAMAMEGSRKRKNVNKNDTVVKKLRGD